MRSTAPTDRRDSWWRSAPVLVIAVIALIMSTAGGAYAVGKNSIGTKQLKKNAVTSSKVKNSSLTSSDVKDSSLTSSDVQDSSLTSSDVQDSSLNSSDIQDGSLLASDFKPGELAPKPAASSRIYFAYIASDGTLFKKSNGIVSSERNSTGYYTLHTDFSTNDCVIVSTSYGSNINTAAQPAGNSPYFFARDVSSPGTPYVNTDINVVITC